MCRHVSRVSGALVLVAGLYIAYYGVYEVRLDRLGPGDGPADPVVDRALRVQQALSDWIDDVGTARLGAACAAAGGRRPGRWPGVCAATGPRGCAEVLARLLSHPGVREDLVLRSRFGFLAFHGGSLERATDVDRHGRGRAGRRVLLRPSSSRRSSAGTSPPTASTRPCSEPLAAFLDHVDVAIAVHGFGRAGLLHDPPAGRPQPGPGRPPRRACCGAGSPTTGSLDDLDDVPVDLRGLHADNPVNRPRQAGVQLELPPRVRGMGPYWYGWDPARPLTPHTEALIEALAEAAVSLGATGGRDPSGPGRPQARRDGSLPGR